MTTAPETRPPTWETVEAGLRLLGLPDEHFVEWANLYESVEVSRTARVAWSRYRKFLAERRAEQSEAAKLAKLQVAAATDIQNLGATQSVLTAVRAERVRQQRDEGYSVAHDDEHTASEWTDLLRTYAGRAEDAGVEGDHESYRRRLLQVATLALAAVEAFDRAEDAKRLADYIEPAEPIREDVRA